MLSLRSMFSVFIALVAAVVVCALVPCAHAKCQDIADTSFDNSILVQLERSCAETLVRMPADAGTGDDADRPPPRTQVELCNAHAQLARVAVHRWEKGKEFAGKRTVELYATNAVENAVRCMAMFLPSGDLAGEVKESETALRTTSVALRLSATVLRLFNITLPLQHMLSVRDPAPFKEWEAERTLARSLLNMKCGLVDIARHDLEHFLRQPLDELLGPNIVNAPGESPYIQLSWDATLHERDVRTAVEVVGKVTHGEMADSAVASLRETVDDIKLRSAIAVQDAETTLSLLNGFGDENRSNAEVCWAHYVRTVFADMEGDATGCDESYALAIAAAFAEGKWDSNEVHTISGHTITQLDEWKFVAKGKGKRSRVPVCKPRRSLPFKPQPTGPALHCADASVRVVDFGEGVVVYSRDGLHRVRSSGSWHALYPRSSLARVVAEAVGDRSCMLQPYFGANGEAEVAVVSGPVALLSPLPFGDDSSMLYRLLAGALAEYEALTNAGLVGNGASMRVAVFQGVPGHREQFLPISTLQYFLEALGATDESMLRLSPLKYNHITSLRLVEWKAVPYGGSWKQAAPRGGGSLPPFKLLQHLRTRLQAALGHEPSPLMAMRSVVYVLHPQNISDIAAADQVIVDALRAGFGRQLAVVDPTAPPEEWVGIIGNAKVIVGAHSGAAALLLLAPEDVALVELPDCGGTRDEDLHVSTALGVPHWLAPISCISASVIASSPSGVELDVIVDAVMHAWDDTRDALALRSLSRQEVPAAEKKVVLEEEEEEQASEPATEQGGTDVTGGSVGERYSGVELYDVEELQYEGCRRGPMWVRGLCYLGLDVHEMNEFESSMLIVLMSAAIGGASAIGISLVRSRRSRDRSATQDKKKSRKAVKKSR